MITVTNLLLENGASSDKVALIYKDTKIPYGALISLIDRVSKILGGVSASGNVMLLLGNTPAMISSIYGTINSDCTSIPVGDTTKALRLSELITISTPSVIITDNQRKTRLSQACKLLSIPIPKIIDINDPHLKLSNPIYDPCNDVGTIMFTSGSTGTPKGVICPHSSMVSAVQIINNYLNHTSDDTIITNLPLSHGYGLYQIFTVLAAGGTVALEPNFLFPYDVISKLEQYDATGFPIVPSMIPSIMEIPEWKRRLSHLRYVTSASASLSRHNFQTLNNAIPGAIIPMYGQTECVRATYLDPKIERSGLSLSSCGIAIPNTNLSLDGEELIVEGPTVMRGYLHNNHSSTFRNGKLYTGDIFDKDEDGLWYYIGRKDDLVKIHGERMTPVEVENALYGLKSLRETVAFTVPDKLTDNRLIVYVVGDVTKKEVLRYCMKNLESYLVPKEIVILNSLPKTDTGKIDRVRIKHSYLTKGN